MADFNPQTLSPTPEIVGDFGRPRVLTLVGGALLFLLVANIGAVFALDRYPVNRSNWLVREKWKLLDRTPSVETLVLGDSSCSQGARPDVLDASLATHTINLCTVGNM